MRRVLVAEGLIVASFYVETVDDVELWFEGGMCKGSEKNN